MTEVRRLLIKRFGDKTAGELIAAYEDSWITDADLDKVKALGFNVVRVPFAYSTLLNEDGTWRADAFARLDWIVCQAWERGLYTILDFHAFLPPAADQLAHLHLYTLGRAEQHDLDLADLARVDLGRAVGQGLAQAAREPARRPRREPGRIGHRVPAAIAHDPKHDLGRPGTGVGDLGLYRGVASQIPSRLGWWNDGPGTGARRGRCQPQYTAVARIPIGGHGPKFAQVGGYVDVAPQHGGSIWATSLAAGILCRQHGRSGQQHGGADESDWRDKRTQRVSVAVSDSNLSPEGRTAWIWNWNLAASDASGTVNSKGKAVSARVFQSSPVE